MTMTANIARDGLTGAERAEIFRRQMLIERDRLEAMHAGLQIVPPEDCADVEMALSVRLEAGELAAGDGVARGQVDDFLVGHTDLEDDNAPIMVVAWSDLAASMAEEGAAEAAVGRLAELGIEQTQLREVMARKVVHQARLQAIREFREVLANPALAYPQVPVAPFACDPSEFTITSAPVPQAPPAPQGPWATMTPTEAVQKFFAYHPGTGGKTGESRKRDGTAWTTKTREQFKLPALLLEQVMGGRPLATITQEDLVTLNDCFEKLHGPSFRKSAKHRDMTIWEIIDETEAKIVAGEKAAAREAKRKPKPNGESDSLAHEAVQYLTRKDLGLGIATTNRHWGFLRQLTNWFRDQHPLPKLDFKPFIMKDKRNPRDLRPAYTKEQGEFLFRLPPWTGARSIAKRMEPGDLIIHDSWYWVPLIGWYSGMRRNEVCSLHLDEIKCVDGDWHFDVQPNDTRDLKTVFSERAIPFADELMRLGLPDYVTALRKAGETMLFPELVPESGIGTLGDAFYDLRWTKIAKALPFLKRGQAIHSFRHTGIDGMKAAKVPSEIRADFGGQVLSNQTEGRYSKAHLTLIREAIKAIPNVTGDLNPAPIRLLPARLRGPRRARNKVA